MIKYDQNGTLTISSLQQRVSFFFLIKQEIKLSKTMIWCLKGTTSSFSTDLSHNLKTTNHSQAALHFLSSQSSTDTSQMKSCGPVLVRGLLLQLHWRQWDSVQHARLATMYRAALWWDAITWLQRRCCNPSISPQSIHHWHHHPLQFLLLFHFICKKCR